MSIKFVSRQMLNLMSPLVLAIGFALSANASGGVPASDDPLETAIARDEKARIERLLPLAEHGDSAAQAKLGATYESEWTGQDYREMLEWFRLSARSGNAGAQAGIGRAYQFGRGVPVDYREAVKWFRLAAARGDTGAQFNLGVIDEERFLEYSEAVKWYRLVAEHGELEGQIQLGSMYEKGHGVAQNFVLAHMWFNLAASHTLDNEASKARDRVAAKMTPAQIAQAQELAHRCEASRYKDCD